MCIRDSYVNLKEWEKLSKEYQNILEAACWEANTWMLAKYLSLIHISEPTRPY
mgnify:CR=1 FL=1